MSFYSQWNLPLPTCYEWLQSVDLVILGILVKMTKLRRVELIKIPQVIKTFMFGDH